MSEKSYTLAKASCLIAITVTLCATIWLAQYQHFKNYNGFLGFSHLS